MYAAALYPSSQQNDLEAGMDGLEDGANAESKENTPTKGGVSGFFGNKGEKGKPKQQLSAFDELDNLQVRMREKRRIVIVSFDVIVFVVVFFCCCLRFCCYCCCSLCLCCCCLCFCCFVFMTG
jgi:hypothetical protein